MKTLTEQTTGVAHGKLILLGEHAVVYGEPAIALPFKAAPVRVKVSKTKEPSRILSSYYQGLLHDAPDSVSNITATINTVCDDLNQSADHLLISITSTIPPERGMGSSAAVATALVRALFAYFEKPLSSSKLLEYVDSSEEIAHGNPSGLDARVTSGEFPVFYKKGQILEPFPLNISGYLIVADTGIKGQTKQTVKDVAKLMTEFPEQTTDVVRSIGRLTVEAKAAIENNEIERLGKLLNQAHAHLKQLNVSNKQLDTLVATAITQGALGAKLTGGGRGGCIIALSGTIQEAETIAGKLAEQGAVDTWIHALGADNNE